MSSFFPKIHNLFASNTTDTEEEINLPEPQYPVYKTGIDPEKLIEIIQEHNAEKLNEINNKLDIILTKLNNMEKNI